MRQVRHRFFWGKGVDLIAGEDEGLAFRAGSAGATTRGARACLSLPTAGIDPGPLSEPTADSAMDLTHGDPTTRTGRAEWCGVDGPTRRQMSGSKRGRATSATGSNTTFTGMSMATASGGQLMMLVVSRKPSCSGKFYDGDNIGIRRGLWAPLMPVDGEGLDGRSPGERFVVDIPRQAAPADRRRRMVPPSTVTASRHSKLSREAAGPEVLVALVECRRNAWYCSLSVQNSSPSRSTEPMTQGPYSLERSVATGVVRGRQSKREIGTWQMTRPASRGSASPM